MCLNGINKSAGAAPSNGKTASTKADAQATDPKALAKMLLQLLAGDKNKKADGAGLTKQGGGIVA